MSSKGCDQIAEHLPSLHRFARSLTRDAARAEDLVQDCVERALTRWHLFEQGTNLRAWLFTICRRLFLNDRRKLSSRAIHVDWEDVELAMAEKARQHGVVALQEVKAAFHALPLNDKVVLSLVALEGLKYEEAASVLNIPVGTVRSRLSRARAKLAEKINGADRQAPPLTMSEARLA